MALKFTRRGGGGRSGQTSETSKFDALVRQFESALDSAVRDNADLCKDIDASTAKSNVSLERIEHLLNLSRKGRFDELEVEVFGSSIKSRRAKISS